MTEKNGKDSNGFGALPPPYAKLRSRLSGRRLPSADPEIGRKMRAMYDDLLKQPIPERFIELLQQLDRAQGNKSR
jgi:hypothetical protein